MPDYLNAVYSATQWEEWLRVSDDVSIIPELRMSQHEADARRVQEICRQFYSGLSYAIPTTEALDAIAFFSGGRLHEYGAGTGYWCRCLNGHGVRATCSDKLNCCDFRLCQAPKLWDVADEDMTKVPARDVAILLCLAPPQLDLGNVLDNCGRLITISMSECADRKQFRSYLETHFREHLGMELPSFHSERPVVRFYEKAA